MEGPQGVVACAHGRGTVTQPDANPDCCSYTDRCEIRHLMADLNSRILQFLGGIRLTELADQPVQAPRDAAPSGVLETVAREKST
jgi:DNA-binding IscR family transcriptional regulator